MSRLPKVTSAMAYITKFMSQDMENFIIASHTVYGATFALQIHVIASSLPCSVQQAI